MLPAKEKLDFLLFWAAICAVWTGAWLLVDGLLVPAALRISPLRLVAIGSATGFLPIIVLGAGRAILYLAGRVVSSARSRAGSLRAAASRGAPPSLTEEYQPSAGPL